MVARAYTVAFQGVQARLVEVQCALAPGVPAFTVVGLPLLMDREVDFISAIIASIRAVAANPVVLAVWGVLIAVILFLGILPLFLGLFVALPVLGHSSWHMYRQLMPDEPEA